jgi:hypothetical protein
MKIGTIPTAGFCEFFLQMKRSILANLEMHILILAPQSQTKSMCMFR